MPIRYSILTFYSSILPFSQPTSPYQLTLPTILSWPDSLLESRHDYIQHLFPLPERSPYNYSAPVVDQAVFSAFRAQTPEGQTLRGNLRLAFECMLNFYGLELVTTSSDMPGFEVRVLSEEGAEAKLRRWVRRIDHNHLRITRIIRSLRVLGLEEYAGAFFERLKRICEKGDSAGKIGDQSLMFWERAAKRPLYVAPDEEDDDVSGKRLKFLVDFEKGVESR